MPQLISAALAVTGFKGQLKHKGGALPVPARAAALRVPARGSAHPARARRAGFKVFGKEFTSVGELSVKDM